MRREVADVVARLRGSDRAELFRVVKKAGLGAEPPAPAPDVVAAYQ